VSVTDKVHQVHQVHQVDEGRAASAPPAPGPAASAAAGSAAARAARRQGWRRLISLAAVVGLLVEGGAYAYLRATEPDPAPPFGPGEATIELGIEHSLFAAETIRVYEGTRVRFVLDNGDPIGHELIVGGPEVHAAHTTGTHASHGSIAGEVSVGPNGQAVTTFRFDDVGEVEFACHLAGHYEYGMHGTIEVVARD
jgi:plastocyanin